MNLEANNYFKNETMGSDNKAIVPTGLRPFSKEASDVLLSVLSSTLRVFARHPFALHLYIHLTEAGVPGMKDGAMTGEQAADILRSLNYTGSGHLEHMPVRCLFVCWLLLLVVMCASCVVVVVVIFFFLLFTLTLSLSVFLTGSLVLESGKILRRSSVQCIGQSCRSILQCSLACSVWTVSQSVFWSLLRMCCWHVSCCH